MKLRNDQSGFSAVEIVVVIVIIGIIGFLGYTFYSNQMNKAADTNQQEAGQSDAANDVKSAPQINSVADLDAAEAVLDQTDPSTDTSQLDAELANF